MSKPKVSRATQVVLNVRAKYPAQLEGVKAYLGEVPYMKLRLDSRAVDRNLLMMAPEEMAQLAMTDPVAAEAAAKRISDLQAKAPPPLPGAGEFEGQA